MKSVTSAFLRIGFRYTLGRRLISVEKERRLALAMVVLMCQIQKGFCTVLGTWRSMTTGAQPVVNRRTGHVSESKFCKFHLILLPLPFMPRLGNFSIYLAAEGDGFGWSRVQCRVT